MFDIYLWKSKWINLYKYFFFRGIEWAGLQSFMSYAYPDPNANGLVKNEILLVDIISGKI